VATPLPGRPGGVDARPAGLHAARGNGVLRVMLVLDGAGAVWAGRLEDGGSTDRRPDRRSPAPRAARGPRVHASVDRACTRGPVARTCYSARWSTRRVSKPASHPSRPSPPAPRCCTTPNEAPDGSQAVVLANWTSSTQRVTLTWKNQSSTLELQPWKVRLRDPAKWRAGQSCRDARRRLIHSFGACFARNVSHPASARPCQGHVRK